MLSLSIPNIDLQVQSIVCECQKPCQRLITVPQDRTHATHKAGMLLYLGLSFLPVLFSFTVLSNHDLYMYTFLKKTTFF